MKSDIRCAVQFLAALLICTACIAAADNSVAGEWKMVSNKDFQFNLDIAQSGNTISGTMTRTNGQEPVDSIRGWAYANGKIQFIRDRSGSFTQIYTGNIAGTGNNRHMDGTFSHDGDGAYPWTAAYSAGYDLSGRWKMVANTDFQFNLDITQSGSSISGTMTRTNGQEPVDNISGQISPDGRIQFTRARAGSFTQVYTGQVAGAGNTLSLQGAFTHNGEGAYPWSAFYVS